MKNVLLILSITLLNLNFIKADEFELVKRLTNTAQTNFFKSTTDKSDNIFITGGFDAFINFNPDSEESELESFDDTDVYLAKLDSDGNHIWSFSFGGVGYQTGITLTTDRHGDILLTGLFNESITFDSTDLNTSFTAVGKNDIFIAKFTNDGDFLWARQIGSNSWEYTRSLSVDSLDNIYVSGTFSTETDFDPSENIFEMTPKFGTDIFILKLDAEGDFLWSKSLEGDYDENSTVSLIDNDGNFCLTGFFHRHLDFDPSEEEFVITNNGYTDVFIAKYTENGEFIWAKSFSGVSRTFISDMTVDEYNNLIIVGDFTWTVDFDPSEEKDSLVSLETNDGFISKLDKYGNHVWVKQFNGSLGVWTSGVKLNSKNEIITIGRFARDCDFDTGNGTLKETTINGSAFYLTKLDSDGELINASVIDGIILPKSISLVEDDKALIGLTLSGDSDFTLKGEEIKVKDYFNNDFLFIKEADIESSIASNSLESTINIFPNPSDGQFNIEYALVGDKATIEVYTETGMLIKRISNVHQSPVNMDLEGYKGACIIKIIQVDGTQYFKGMSN